MSACSVSSLYKPAAGKLFTLCSSTPRRWRWTDYPQTPTLSNSDRSLQRGGIPACSENQTKHSASSLMNTSAHSFSSNHWRDQWVPSQGPGPPRGGLSKVHIVTFESLSNVPIRAMDVGFESIRAISHWLGIGKSSPSQFKCRFSK